MKRKIYRAGTVPYSIKDGKIVMLFMIPSDPKYGGDQPQISKGKQEEDELLSETAIREAEEELGLKRNNILTVFKVGMFLGRTEIYAAKINNPDDFSEFNFETKNVVWLTEDDFEKEGRELHIPVVKEVVRVIKEKEGV